MLNPLSDFHSEFVSTLTDIKSSLPMTEECDVIFYLFENCINTRLILSILNLRNIYFIMKVQQNLDDQSRAVSNLALSTIAFLNNNNYTLEQCKTARYRSETMDIITALVIQEELTGQNSDIQADLINWINSSSIRLNDFKLPFHELMKLVSKLRVVNLSMLRCDTRDLVLLIKESTCATEIILFENTVNLDVINALQNTSITHLTIKSCKLEVEQLNLRHIRNLSHLRLISLSLKGEINISNNSLVSVEIKNCNELIGPLTFPVSAGLKELHIENCEKLRYEFQANFSEVVSFKLVNCVGYPVNAPLDFTESTQLAKLHVRLPSWKGPLSLPSRGNLEEIDLEESRAINGCVWDFSEHPRLRFINLTNCQAFNAHLIFGARNTQFELLDLNNCFAYSRKIDFSMLSTRIHVKTLRCRHAFQVILSAATKRNLEQKLFPPSSEEKNSRKIEEEAKESRPKRVIHE